MQFCTFKAFAEFKFFANPNNWNIYCTQFHIEFTQFCTFNIYVEFKSFANLDNLYILCT